MRANVLYVFLPEVYNAISEYLRGAFNFIVFRLRLYETGIHHGSVEVLSVLTISAAWRFGAVLNDAAPTVQHIINDREYVGDGGIICGKLLYNFLFKNKILYVRISRK